MTVNEVVAILGYVFLVAGAIAIIRSKYRDATTKEREKYIAALEARNKLLEDADRRRGEEMRDMQHRYHNLEGRVLLLQDLVLGKCRHAQIDPGTGGCKNCSLGMVYGQGGT